MKNMTYMAAISQPRVDFRFKTRCMLTNISKNNLKIILDPIQVKII